MTAIHDVHIALQEEPCILAKYTFKPTTTSDAGILRTGAIHGNAQGRVEAELVAKTGSSKTVFTGHQQINSKAVDVVLVWDPERSAYVMRRLAAHLRLQKHAGGPLPPLDTPAPSSAAPSPVANASSMESSQSGPKKRPADHHSPVLTATKKVKAANPSKGGKTISRANTPRIASPDAEFEFDLSNAQTPTPTKPAGSSALNSPAMSESSLPRATTGGKGLAIMTSKSALLSDDEVSDDTGSEYEDDGLISAIDRQMSQPIPKPVVAEPRPTPSKPVAAPAPVSTGPFGSMNVASMLGGSRNSPGLSDDEDEDSSDEGA